MAFDSAGFRAAAIKSGYKAADVDKFIQTKQEQQAKLQLINQGALDVTDVAKTDPVLAAQALKGGAKPKPSAEEQKKVAAQAPVTGLVESLEKSYQAAKGGTFGVGPGARIKGKGADILGKLGLDPNASVYNDARSGFAATLKSLTGDTGVLTDQDFERLTKLLPTLGSTEEEATQKFNQLRDQITAKFGGEKKSTTFKPVVENKRGAIASLTDVLFPSATTYVEKGLTGELAQQKQPITPTEMLPTIAGPLGLLLSRPDVFKEAIGPSAEIAGAATLAGGIKNKLGGLGNILNPKPAISAARQQAAEAVGKNVSTEAIVKAGDKYVTQDPTAQRLWTDVLKPALAKNKDISIPDLLSQVKVWNDAYTNAGKVGKTALAGLNDALARSAKDVIKKEAPEVAKQTAKLAKVYGIEKTLGRFGPAAIGAAGATGGAFILGKLLGKKNP